MEKGDSNESTLLLYAGERPRRKTNRDYLRQFQGQGCACKSADIEERRREEGEICCSARRRACEIDKRGFCRIRLSTIFAVLSSSKDGFPNCIPICCISCLCLSTR